MLRTHHPNKPPNANDVGDSKRCRDNKVAVVEKVFSPKKVVEPLDVTVVYRSSFHVPVVCALT